MSDVPLEVAVGDLSPRQRELLSRLVRGLTVPVEVERNPDSDFATPEFVEAMSDTLRGHHVVSSKPLGKEHFEHALASLLTALGHSAVLSPMGFPGADIQVDEVPWSLKTQADQAIRPDFIHISKFMELGKGAWNDEADLAALRDRMLQHMEGYERIFTMRYLTGAKALRGQGRHEYELVEIPKSVLALAHGVPCVMHHVSRQSPKPGSCEVVDEVGRVFELYFDGGTERKLQVRKLRVDVCQVHARWRFETA